MKKINLSSLAAAAAARNCVLFAGAGLTSKSGGATWSELIEFLKEKFSYSSPLKDNFRIIGDMCRKFGPETIYEAVRGSLRDAKIDEPIEKLTEIPWFTVFTTNYDLALEGSLVKNQKLNIRTIVTGDEFALTGIDSEMLCVKLMGSLDINFGQPGSMILDQGDLAVARETRPRIFNTLAAHAANRSFLFIGYSFNDNLFFEILDRLVKSIGTPRNTYYTVLKDEPDEEKLYLFKQYGIEIIPMDLADFAERFYNEVKLHNPEDYSLKRIPIGSTVVPISVSKMAHFLEVYDPVLYEKWETHITANEFFKGNTSSFKPFSLNWHFPRKEINIVVDTILKKKNNDRQPSIVRVVGNPGTGRTFVILAALYELISKHQTIAIGIPSYAMSPIPTFEEISEFWEEVRRVAEEYEYESLKRLVFWAEFALEDTFISQFKKLASDFEYPICLIYEDLSPSQISDQGSQRKGQKSINVDIDLTDEEKNELANYLLDITRKHRLPEISKDETYRIIKEEKQFLPIMYRIFDPARRSINRIIQEEFKNISDNDTRICISLCALATSIDLEMPIYTLQNALSKSIGKQLIYPDTFEIINKKAKAFLKESRDIYTNPIISVYHSLIAQYIVKLLGRNKMDEYLLDIAETVDIRSRIEADFIGNLLIVKGVNRTPGAFTPYTDDGLEKALLSIKSRQPARPIIHHLARFYSNRDISNRNVIPLLHEALAEPKERYALWERKENILTTLAKSMWDQNKKELLHRERDDPETQEIIGLLKEARKCKIPNIHTYDVHARILEELWKCRRDKMDLFNEALEVIEEGLETCINDPDASQRLEALRIELLSELDITRAENAANQLLIERNDGTGYYTLAVIEYYKNSNLRETIKYLNKAMTGEKYPSGVIALKIEILLQDASPNYEDLLQLVEQLEYDVDFQETWKSAFNKAVVYTINGKYDEATKCFKTSHQLAPYDLQRYVQVFWMDKGHRKVHTGKIGRDLTEREGRIYSHNIKGYNYGVFFDPRRQKRKKVLKPGLLVNFELGFSPRGPIAFDVRPQN